MTRTALIALDWGTSSLRAFRLTAAGDVLDTRASGHGIQHLPEPGIAGFEAAFAAITAGWPADVPVVASGMVGSAQGWAEAPYLPCPASLSDLCAHAATVNTAKGRVLTIAPGLIHRPDGAAPDVMRGEEIQIAGAIAPRPDWQAGATLVLPGTHSKWANVADGAVTGFATYMTGELFAVLRAHSILGRLMEDGAAPHGDAFAMGVAQAAQDGPGGLTHQLFGTRTLGLTGQLPGAALAEYCSGLLIGHEIASGLGRRGDGPLILVGSAALCARYDAALHRIAGRGADAVIDNPAPAGLTQFARDAGLLSKDHAR